MKSYSRSKHPATLDADQAALAELAPLDAALASIEVPNLADLALCERTHERYRPDGSVERWTTVEPIKDR